MFRAIRRSTSPVKNARRIVTTVATGTLAVTILMTLLLICWDITVEGRLRVRTLMGFGVIGYALLAVHLSKKRYHRVASWMLISLYQAMVAVMLVQWGINAPVSILAVCFVTILPGVLLGSRYIFPVLAYTVAIIIGAQLLHAHDIHTPNLAVLSEPSSFWDVIIYITIIAILALVSWLSKSQAEQSLLRAADAELRLKNQKQTIAEALEQESIALRQVQLKQFRQLYQFALIGQSTAATLHELSNQLTELNFDIDDLKTHDKNSEAITDAQDTISQINHTVRNIRQQLNSHANDRTAFDGLDALNRALDDATAKFEQRQVQLTLTAPSSEDTSVPLFGSQMAYMQILSILLNNALHACQDSDGAWVHITATVDTNALLISVKDSGPGIDAALRKTIFSPKTSTKPNGLGVGLYIAKHLTTSQFGGKIELAKAAPSHGAEFTLNLPFSYPEEPEIDEK